MPKLRISPDLEMFYLVDDYTDPWTKPETILLLHGNCESSASWYAWAPLLARHYRVVRADMRGFGASTPMPRDFPWTLDIVIDDFIHLMDTLGIERFHLAGAKIGGFIARPFASRRANRVSTLTLVGTPPPFRAGSAATMAARTKDVEQHGNEPQARRSMAARLGSTFPPEGVEYWSKFMGSTPVSTQLGFVNTIPCMDITADLPRIACPTLVITTTGSGLGTVEETRAWQQLIPNSELLVLPGNSYHVAVTDAEPCAKATLDFIARKGTG